MQWKWHSNKIIKYDRFCNYDREKDRKVTYFDNNLKSESKENAWERVACEQLILPSEENSCSKSSPATISSNFLEYRPPRSIVPPNLRGEGGISVYWI